MYCARRASSLVRTRHLRAACGDNVNGNIAIDVPPAWRTPIGEMVALTPYHGADASAATRR